MGKDDWYFVVSTAIGIAGLLGVPWKEVFGKVKNKMPRRWREAVLVIALLGSLVMSGIGWYKVSHILPDTILLNVSVYDPPYPAPMRVISDTEFQDQDIPLDGHIYERCKFKNVCFLYDGGAFGLHNSTVADHWKVCIRDQKLKNYGLMLEELRLLIRPATTKTTVELR